MNYLWAFLIGGAICAVGQLFIDLTKLTPARILTIKLFSEMQKGADCPLCILSVFMIISQFYSFVLDSF